MARGYDFTVSAGSTRGMLLTMTERNPVDQARIESRAKGLTAEEKENGVDDAAALAEAVLAESDERAADRTRAPGGVLEERRSEDTVDLTE
jgi:hypothetical protein